MTDICICGGGSLGHVVAAVLSSRADCRVHLLTARPQLWQHAVRCVDPDGRVFSGPLHIVTSDPAEVIPQCSVVLLCLPGFLIERTLRQIKPFISSQAVGSIVSSTGFFFRAHEIFPSSASLFGFQRVPFIARVEQYGSSALLLGYKKQLFLATENLPSAFIDSWSEWLQTPVAPLSSYLEAALTNSNPLLHPSRLYGMWHDWHEGLCYPQQTYFYAQWDIFSAQTYIDCDNEFQQLTRSLGIQIPSVLDYYESVDAGSLMNKLRSIEAFKPILAPMVQTDGGWIPDFSSRYFTEDFPFGLQLVRDLAASRSLPTPVIDRVLAWGNSHLPSARQI
ncbi:MAG: NAD/NADP octopine/nopaline dehydrogenase family protein [Paludibacteraceae bacterium]|nr:NAD/NADP octopine/nopaline dehydrogenase family protein [Paludibacteraceae bacterium]